MAINFPDSPSLNETFTSSGKTWKWNGTLWKLEAPGPGVTSYATIADLITASKGSLDPGYYEVTTVPDYHPQHPRIITYWDGASFEPQISTGFEDRPDTTSEVWVFDAKEERFRTKRQDGEKYYGSKTLGAGDLTLVKTPYQEPDNILPTWDGEKLVTHPTDRRARFYADNHGLGGTPNCTLIFAGKCPGPFGGYAVAINLGVNSTSRWLAIGPSSASTYTWIVTYFASENSLATVPRATDGDVAIVTYDHGAAQVIAWINGVKFGPFSKSLVLDGSISFLNSLANTTEGIDGSEAYFGRISGNVFSDADAAAWTAWLQDRYSIPEL